MSESSEPGREPRLFMTELRVNDWSAAVRWYTETLELPLILIDEPQGFALLGDPTNGQLALKKTSETQWESPTRVRLVFKVDDLEACYRRLKLKGVDIGDVTINDREHYREVRLLGPEGILITLFDWDRRKERI